MGTITLILESTSTIGELAAAMKKIYHNSTSDINIIGARHAEKLYETLLAREEYSIAEDLGDYFRVAADNRDLNYNKYFTEGKGSIAQITEYNSHNTNKLSKEQLISLFNRVGFKG